MTTGKRYDFLLKQIKDRDASAEGQKPAGEELRAPGKEGSILESGENTVEPRVETIESRADREKPREVTADRPDREAGVESKEGSNIESRVNSLDDRALNEAIEEAIKKPKLGVYSPVVAAILRYKAITTPRYSMGQEIKVIVEQALKGAYPELYEEVQKRMNS
jgi:hypothetical protein